MRRSRAVSAILPLLLAVSGQGLAQDRSALAAVETIVQRMAQARTNNQALLRAYSVTRNYTLFGADGKEEKAQVLVRISFVPPSSKKFVILKSSGTGFGEKAVRQMLEHETDIVLNHNDTELSLANYEFSLLREEPCGRQRCYVLAISPRRKDKTLLRGHIWVDTATYLLHRTEGEPAKGPSWWLRDSSIIFSYGDVDGMWLQIGSQSTSNVRFVGRFTMVSRDLEYTLSKRADSPPPAPAR